MAQEEQESSCPQGMGVEESSKQFWSAAIYRRF
jgi:hypothetical protein